MKRAVEQMRRGSWLITLACGLAVWTDATTALAQGMKRPGIYGTIKDPDGNPVPKLKVWIKGNITTAERLTIETGKAGTFAYPNVEFLSDGYQFGLDSTEYYIQSFDFVARKGSHEIFQERDGKLAPHTQAQFPVILYRAGNCTMNLVVAKIASYAGPVPSAAQQVVAESAQKDRSKLSALELADEAEALNDFAAAAEHLNKALEEQPNDPDLIWRRAQVLAKSGDRTQAVRLGNRVAALQPERKGVRLQTASWLLEDGDAENAISLAKREQELDPDNPLVYKVLFLAMQDATASKEELEAVATQWVAKAPDNPEAMVRLAGVKAARGDFAGAEELYRKIAAVDPANADRMFYNVGASILNQQGVGEEDRRRAVEAFKQAIAINPNNAKAYLQMGNAYAGLGEMDNAKSAWREFIKLQPESADAKALQDLVK